MTTKNKRTTITSKNYLILTPLALETCAGKIQAIAYFDLAQDTRQHGGNRT